MSGNLDEVTETASSNQVCESNTAELGNVCSGTDRKSDKRKKKPRSESNPGASLTDCEDSEDETNDDIGASSQNTNGESPKDDATGVCLKDDANAGSPKDDASAGSSKYDSADVWKYYQTGVSSKYYTGGSMVSSASPNKDDNNGKGKKILKEIGWFALKTALISGAVIGGTAVALPAIGFGALGPIAGSLAAGYQSAVLGGTIASGSAFATLQSVGMVGLSAAAKGAVVAGSAAVSAATSAAKKKDKP